jgi:taurine dioxygenase
LRGCRARHVFEFSTYDRPAAGAVNVAGRIQEATHDVVTLHPDTRKPLLYVNRLMTKRIEGIDEAESAALLDRLFDHAERPEFIYTHKWRPGDVLLWDNCCTIHARTDFDPAEQRHLRRFTIRGTHLP